MESLDGSAWGTNRLKVAGGSDGVWGTYINVEVELYK